MRLPTKSELKESLVTALMVAPTLAVILIAAVFSLALGSIGTGPDERVLSVVLGVVSVLSIIVSTVLSFKWQKRFPTALLSVILWLCFFSHLTIVLSGTTDFLDDHFFQAMTIVFSFPVFS